MTDPNNWRIICKKNIWGVADYYQKSILRTRPEDKLIIYVKGGLLAGIFEVASEPYKNHQQLFQTHKVWGKGESFPNRVNLNPLLILTEPIDIRSLLPRLEFIRNKKVWASYFFRAMLLIPQSDYEIIQSAMHERSKPLK